jgi:ATP-dependent helicase HrpA
MRAHEPKVKSKDSIPPIAGVDGARLSPESGLSRDQGRLRRMASRLREKPKDEALQAEYAKALAASVAARARREQNAPAPRFDEELPVAREAVAILEAINAHQVVIVAGETGSGKTTQLPKLCLAAGRGRAGMIGCTQPRRIAARAVARRVAEELQSPLGGAVGYQVRFTENVGEDTYIKFMTDGILLAEIQSDRWLSRYDTIIVDEAHERSLNIDFLLGYLKQLLDKRRDLKVIVTSATIDTERFAKHFANAPVINVEGRSYPVELRYRPPEGEGEDAGERTMNDAIVGAVDEIVREDPRGGGDVLVFLPGEREIRDAHRALADRKYRGTEVLALYARLSAKDQDRVFSPGQARRIVLATNVAETSLTVPRIRYVVDPGAARVKRYSPRQKLDRLHIEPISQASADQRKGRCGRVAAGICYRLYSEPDFASRPRYTDPEILRASLGGVILRMLSLGLGRVEDFPFIDPPDPRAVADGWQQLGELAAVDKERKLLPVGRQMARLPIDVKLARMLVAAQELRCLREVAIIAAFLGIQDPRERPPESRGAADAAHAGFADPASEFAGVLNLWKAYNAAHEELTQSKLRAWCEKNFLGFLRMREWRELHRQLLLVCEELGWSLNDTPALAPELHRALIAGLPTQVGHKLEKGVFEAPRQRRFQLFPGSALAKAPPAWVLVATLLDTQKVWGLMAARIEPDWVMAQLPHLLSRKHFDPHWSRAQGRVLGSEMVSLFGLVLAPKKPVHYGGLYPAEAREIFVRQALLTGEINTRTPFVARNLKTLEKAQEEEAKLRRAGLVADEDWMARWYLDRLPPELNSAQGLDSWYAKLAPEKKKALEWGLADLLPGEGSEAERFPKYFPLGDVRLALHYRFEPGAEDDGVTLDVPLHLLMALDPARLTWLVPGLVEERAAELIRGLPKAQRRNYVPAPDFARAFREAHPQPEADAMEGTLARFLTRSTGAPVQAIDFEPGALPPHLRVNLRLGDSKGKVLAMSRDLRALQHKFSAQAERAFAESAGERLAKQGLVQFPDTALPESVPGAAGVPAYPALVDEGETVAVAVFADPSQARAEHERGVRTLARIALADPARQARRQLPVSPKLGLLYAAIESSERLRADIVEAALNALLSADLAAIRERSAFDSRVAAAARELFPEAMKRLQLAEAILAGYAEARAKLESKLMGWASGNLDDIRERLAALVQPGFLRQTPPALLAEFPRYLRGLSLRAERAIADPLKDQARMLELRPYDEALRAAPAPLSADWQEFRHDLEELRVQTFAQELGTRRQVSHKRLARQLERLR